MAITAIVAIALIGPMIITPKDMIQNTNVQVNLQSGQEENPVSPPVRSPDEPEQGIGIDQPDSDPQPDRPESEDSSGRVWVRSARVLTYPGLNTTLIVKFSNTTDEPDSISIIVIQKADDFFPDPVPGFSTVIPPNSHDFEIRFFVDRNGLTFPEPETISVIVTLLSGTTIPIALSTEVAQ